MTCRRFYSTAAMLLVAMMLISGCAGTSEPSKFFLLLTRKSSYRAQPSSGDVAGILAALNRTLTDFSREIAAAIQSLGS